MLIQKIFHVRLGLPETKSFLERIQKDPEWLQDVAVAPCEEDRAARLDFTTGNGFHAQLNLVTLPSDDPDRTLFRSSGGNVEVAGMLEFVPIRDSVTEVQLTIDYAIKSPFHRLLDLVTASLDGFVNRQLRCITAQLSSRELAPQRRAHASGMFFEPQLAH
jgi:hypothetical protein